MLTFGSPVSNPGSPPPSKTKTVLWCSWTSLCTTAIMESTACLLAFHCYYGIVIIVIVIISVTDSPCPLLYSKSYLCGSRPICSLLAGRWLGFLRVSTLSWGDIPPRGITFACRTRVREPCTSEYFLTHNHRLWHYTKFFCGFPSVFLLIFVKVCWVCESIFSQRYVHHNFWT